MVALQGDKICRKRIFGETLDDAARVRPAVHIIAKRDGQGVLDRICFQVAADRLDHPIEQIPAAVNVANRIDTSGLRHNRLPANRRSTVMQVSHTRQF